MRRPRATALALLSLLTLGALAIAPAAPAFACGCGAIVGPEGSKATTSGEQAIISWNGEQETMDIAFDLSTGLSEAGLLIPTPTHPVVSAGDARVFALLEDTIAPTITDKTDWWGFGYVLPAPPEPSTRVIKRLELGPVEAVTLEATDTASLALWLSSNGYVLTKGMTESLQSYIALGWSFTALKLTGETALNGRVDPIRLTFDTARPVYPMRFASTDSAPTQLRLYVFDAGRDQVAQADAPTVDIEADVEVLWAGKVADSRLRALGSYLTAFDIRYHAPAKDITSDLGFVADSTTSDVKREFTRYRMVTLLGVPVATLIVGWVVLGLALVTGHFVGRRRAR